LAFWVIWLAFSQGKFSDGRQRDSQLPFFRGGPKRNGVARRDQMVEKLFR
jgi:hypothetical protein